MPTLNRLEPRPERELMQESALTGRTQMISAEALVTRPLLGRRAGGFSAR